MRVVITYGYIPQKWMNIVTGKPTNDFLSAMHNTVDIGTALGYVDYNNKDTSLFGGADLQIRGRNDTLSAIPNAIGKDSYFGNVCNPDLAGEGIPYCLAFMSQF